jgi:hypothetical protein
MAVYYPLNRGQPDTGAFESLLRVKPLKNAKQLVGIFHVEPAALVPNEPQ